MRDVRIGTSGWAYRDWAGPFYPDEVKAAGRLEYISRRFRTPGLFRCLAIPAPSIRRRRGWKARS